MTPEWIDHRGKRILVADFSKAGTLEDALAIEDEFIKLLSTAGEKALWLNHFSGRMQFYPKFVQHVMNIGRSGIVKDNTHKGACLIDSGLKANYIHSYNIATNTRSISIFQEADKALEWLVS